MSFLGILGVLNPIPSSDYSLCTPTGHRGHEGHGGHDLNAEIIETP